ncbi:MAG: hypothetical protein ABW033_10890 [Acidimicrobiia bacterium]
MASVDAKRDEFWITTAITSGIIAVLSGAALGAWAWWIDKTDWLERCAVGDSSDANYGELVWKLVPPGPRCVWTQEANGFDATSPVNWSWSILIGLAVVSGVLACGATARYLWIQRSGRDLARSAVLSGD